MMVMDKPGGRPRYDDSLAENPERHNDKGKNRMLRPRDQGGSREKSMRNAVRGWRGPDRPVKAYRTRMRFCVSMYSFVTIW